jgi:signal transduction histidine kinase
MRDRFRFDPSEEILFIDFAGLRIDRREQVDELARLVRDAVTPHGGRVYAIVNYEGTEIAPEIIDYYGECIKQLQDRHALATVRYSSNGFTRSVLRYLGAAKDLDSNTFTTREEAIRAIRELAARTPRTKQISLSQRFSPHRSILGLTLLIFFAAVIVWIVVFAFFPLTGTSSFRVILVGIAVIVQTGITVYLMIYQRVIKPARQIEASARRLVIGSAFEPVSSERDDELGRLSRAYNEAARELRRDIERLSGLYHIALLMGTGADVSRICELLTRKVALLLDAGMCVILLFDERDQSLSAQAPGHGVRDEDIARLRTPITARTIASLVFQTGEPYLTNDAVHDLQISRAAADLLGVREMLAVPLQAQDRTLGTLEVMNKVGGFVEEDKRLATIFAAQAAQLLSNARLFARVRESERLAAVGHLIAGVAHEVRNPLCGITTTLSALARQLDDREVVRPHLDVIRSEVDQLNHLMEQLLEHSRPARREKSLTDLHDLLAEVIGEFTAQARHKDVAISCTSEPNAPGLHLDRRKMHGVIANLLDNALHHTPPGGRISLSLSHAMENGAQNGARKLRIEVADNGEGIAPAHLPQVFEPFFTTRRTGTGLGLAIVRKSILDHDGTISVRSTPGRGTTLTIDLPIDLPVE